MKRKRIEKLIDIFENALSSKKMKVTLYITVVLWVALATQIAVNYFFTESFEITQAFVKTNTEDQSSSIEIVAEYEGEYLSPEEKKEIIQALADSIELKIDNEIMINREDGRTEYSYQKHAKSADTEIKVISIEDSKGDTLKINHYILVRLKIKRSIHEIERYKNLLKNTLDQLGINEKQVNMQYFGTHDGKLSQEEKKKIVSDIINDLQGKVALEFNEDETYTVYGYSGHINEYIVSLGSRVNIHIVVTYDQELDKTKLYLASPIINESW